MPPERTGGINLLIHFFCWWFYLWKQKPWLNQPGQHPRVFRSAEMTIPSWIKRSRFLKDTSLLMQPWLSFFQAMMILYFVHKVNAVWVSTILTKLVRNTIIETFSPKSGMAESQMPKTGTLRWRFVDIYTVRFFGYRQIEDFATVEPRLENLIRELLAKKNKSNFL